MYRTHWEGIRHNSQAVRVLGAVCRTRTAPDAQLLERWFGAEAVGQVSDLLRRYLRVDTDGRWRFFHNSFRLFLQRETCRTVLSRTVDPGLAHQSHRELAGLCMREPSDSPVRWDELFHRVQAEDHGLVCQAATTVYFRGQLAAGRSLDAVKTDTALARQSAVLARDPLAYARLGLADDEWERRGRPLAEFGLPEHWLRLRETARAVEAIRDGNRLRVGDAAALTYAVQFAQIGVMDEARRLFDLAEPLDLLSGSSDAQRADLGRELLLEWSEAAPLFRPLQETLDRIAAVPLSDHIYPADDRATGERRLRAYLYGRAGGRLVEQVRWDDLPLVFDRLCMDQGPEKDVLFELQLDAAHTARLAGDDARRDEYTHRLRETYEPDRLDGTRRLLLAELLALNGDQSAARSVLADALPAAPDFGHTSAGDGFARFMTLYRHARLLATLGDYRPPMQLVPDLGRTSEDGVRYFLSGVIRVAQIEAAGAGGEPTHPSLLISELFGVMRRFHQDFKQTRHWLYWSACQAARGGLYRRLVRATSRHGPEALDALRAEFSAVWSGDAARYWWPDVRRDVALAFADADPDRYGGWAAAQLDEMEPGLTEDTDPHSAAQSLNHQAEAWAALGRPERVGPLYGRAVAVSARLSGEDYQVDHWMQAFDRFANQYPEEARARLEWLANGLYGVREAADRGPLRSAAGRLLRTASRLNPGIGIDLFARFRDHGLQPHTYGLMALARGMLDRADPPTRLLVYCVADLVIPFESSPDGHLVESVIRAIHGQAGTEAAEWAAEYLFRRVAAYAYPRARLGWWQEADRLGRRLGLSARPPEPTAEEKSEPERDSLSGGADLERDPTKLRLKDGEPVPLDQVLASAGDLDQLARWASSEDGGSWFDWRPVLERLVVTRPIAELAQFMSRTRISHRVTGWLLAKGGEAAEAGEKARAAAYADLALGATSKYDWSRRHSGGHRLDACRLLVAADRLNGRREVWRALEVEPCREPAALFELLDLLCDDPDGRDLWGIAEDRLRVVFDSPAVLPPASDPVPCRSGDTPGAVLAALLIHHADHPARAVRLAATRACAYALRGRDPDVTEAVRAALNAEGSPSATAIELLATVAQADPTGLEPFRGELRQLCGSGDVVVSVTARRLCPGAGVDPAPVEHRALPDEYFREQLLVSQAHLHVPREVRDGEPLPDTDRPAELLATVRHVILPAAMDAEMDPTILLDRAVRLMQRLRPYEEWSAGGERRLRELLDNAGLKLTFTRPRAQFANAAARLLVGELWRAGLVSDGLVERLVEDLRSSDPGLFFTEPSRRPAEVPVIDGGEMWDREARGWLDGVAAGCGRLPSRMADGRLVLAERSKLEYLARTLRIEKRWSAVLGGNWSPSNLPDADDWLPRSPDWRVLDYSGLELGHRAADCPVIRHVDVVLNSPGSGWLAFNPAVARRLGWRHAPGGLFRWEDPNGEPMVESLWWEDGPVGDRDRWINQTVGRGWMVLAAPTAYARLTAELGPLRQYRSLYRSAKLDEEGAVDRTATDSISPDRPEDKS